MAVTFDNAASAAGNGTVATVNITCDANSLVLVGVHLNGGPTPSSPTFDGNAMTLVAGPINDVYVWRYHGHASGSRTASVTRSDTGDWVIGVVSVTGFDSGNPIGTAVTEGADETTPFETGAITTGSTDWLIIDAVMSAADSLAMAADAAQTERVSRDSYTGGASSFGMSTKPGSASTTTMAWTATGTVFGVGMIAVPVRPAASGATYTLTAEQGTYTITGSNARADFEINADTSTYTITGQAANLLFAHRLVADQGSYTISGQIALLDYSGETAAPDTGTGSSGVFKLRRALVVSTTGRAKWINYIPVKQVEGSVPGTYDNNGAVEIELLLDATGLTEWEDYIPIVEVVDGDSGKWRYDNSGWIPILFVE